VTPEIEAYNNEEHILAGSCLMASALDVSSGSPNHRRDDLLGCRTDTHALNSSLGKGKGREHRALQRGRSWRMQTPRAWAAHLLLQSD